MTKKIMDRLDLIGGSYTIEEAYEFTKRSLRPRLQQLLIELTKDKVLPAAKSLKLPIPKSRSLEGLIIFRDGDWYSQKDWAAGNVISLIQYFLGINADEAIEWANNSFIPTTCSDLDEIGNI